MDTPRLRVADLGDHDCCPRCTAITRAARRTADLMGLRDWTFEVAHNPPGAGELMTIEIAPTRRLGRLRAAADFEDRDAAEQRHALVHELVHAILHGVVEAVVDGISGELAGIAYRVYIGSVTREVERATDSLAATLAPHLPFIAWGEE